MLRKKRLKCGRIPARLFLACHQKSNTFKCKQFCCAKPMCACLSAGCPSVPPQRRAAVHSLRLPARHIRTQTRRSLNECVLVRLASQAVQPSQNIVAYRPWSGRYAPCFSPTSPRFIRHRRRFGDVARLSQLAIEHCGAAMGSLIIKISRSLTFTLLQLE